MPTSKTILVVEDDEALLLVVKKALEASGYSVVAAADSVLANSAARLRGGIVDLLLADINLPGLTGGEYGDFLKTINPNLRILYMSGEAVADKEVLKHLRGQKAAFIAKPFTPQELVLAVKRALGEITESIPEGDGGSKD